LKRPAQIGRRFDDEVCAAAEGLGQAVEKPVAGFQRQAVGQWSGRLGLHLEDQLLPGRQGAGPGDAVCGPIQVACGRAGRRKQGQADGKRAEDQPSRRHALAGLGHDGGELHRVAGVHDCAVGPFKGIAPVGTKVQPKEAGAAARNRALDQPAMLRIRPGDEAKGHVHFLARRLRRDGNRPAQVGADLAPGIPHKSVLPARGGWSGAEIFQAVAARRQGGLPSPAAVPRDLGFQAKDPVALGVE